MWRVFCQAFEVDVCGCRIIYTLGVNYTVIKSKCIQNIAFVDVCVCVYESVNEIEPTQSSPITTLLCSKSKL